MQALIGLFDYAKVSGDAEAQRLFDAGNAEAQAELPHYDTGTWSLYEPGQEDTRCVSRTRHRISRPALLAHARPRLLQDRSPFPRRLEEAAHRLANRRAQASDLTGSYRDRTNRVSK